MIYLVTKQYELYDRGDSNIQVLHSLDYLFNYFINKKVIGVDSETTGFCPHTNKLLSIQLGDFNNQFVIDTSTIDIKTLIPLFADESKLFIFQNAKFDLRFLYKHNIVPSKVFDTFLAEKVCYTGYSFLKVKMSLDVLVTKYTEYSVDKSIRGSIHREGLYTRVIQYAADDVKYLEAIMDKQMVSIKNKGLTNALNLDNMFVKALAYTEFSGIYLNTDLWKKKMVSDNSELIKTKSALNNWIIANNKTKYIDTQLDLFSTELRVKINWSSEKQVIPLMKELGVNTKVIDDKTGGLKDSIESKVLKPQKNVSDLIPLYLEYKKAEKVVSTYGENWLKQVNPNTGRIHTNFNQIMNTGRMSCGGKDKSRRIEYVNIQNIPTGDTRKCFTNQHEYTTLINADFAGQEAVVFANKTLDKALLRFYDEGLGDQHSYVASLCFRDELIGVELDEIKKIRPDLRQKAKAAGFAIQFGGQGITIAENLGISEEEGNRIYNAYFEAFPDIKQYFTSVKRHALDNGYILFNNITGRKSYIDFYNDYKELKKEITPKFWEEYREEKAKNSIKFQTKLKPKVREFFKMQGMIERKALNYPVQGSSAEVTKLAVYMLFKWIVENNLFNKVLISNIVHDEILIECPETMSKSVANITKYCMEYAGSKFFTRVPLKAEPCINKYWSH